MSQGDEGSGTMMRTVVWVSVFIAVFVMLSAVVLTIGPSNAAASKASYNDDIAVFDGSILSMNTFYNTTDGGNSYDITPGVYGGGIELGFGSIIYMGGDPMLTDGGWSNMTFAADSTIRFYAVSNWYLGSTFPYHENGELEYDRFYFWTHDGIWDVHSEWVTYQDVLENIKEYDGYSLSAVPISVGNSYTAYFMFREGVDPETALVNHNGFSVSLGRYNLDIAKDQNSAWNVLINVLTFNFRSGVDYLDYMIAIPVFAAYAFILYWGFTRLIP